MGYLLLVLGLLGMFGFWIIYFKVDPRSFWYEVGMLGWILSWLVHVLGLWQVLR